MTLPSCPTTTAAKIARVSPISAQTSAGSTVIPTETKNTATNISLSGAIWCSTRSPRPDSAVSIPAKNAPSATE